MTLRLVSNQSGFGFLGMVFLVLFIGVSAAAFFTMLTPILSTSQTTLTYQRFEILKEGILKYMAHHGGSTAPTTLDLLVTDPGTDPCAADTTSSSATFRQLQGWCGPYVEVKFEQDTSAFKTDGWGMTIQYNSGGPTLTSYGPNRTDNSGGGDDLVFSI